MNLDEMLKRAAVVGAAGKMGSGIALLLLQEMAMLEARTTGYVGQGAYRLVLIDVVEDALLPLKHYLREQLKKFAEKNIVTLREAFAGNVKLVTNEEMIKTFLDGAMDIADFDTEIERVKHAHCVFEAILEDVEIKVQFYTQLNKLCCKDTYYFTNTSSIPIGLLNEKSGIGNRIIGFHFYNPPAVQKLLEIISPATVDQDLKTAAVELANRLGKVIVHSRDVAGFIGNGHFLREIIFGVQMTKKLMLPSHEAITIVNMVTQNHLMRPMGLFQLLDYVGLELVIKIATIMSEYLDDSPMEDTWINQLVERGILGGQYPDGSQKDGFFQYDKKKIIGVYSLEEEKYVAIPDVLQWVGNLPSGLLPWKDLVKQKNIEEILQGYFPKLFKSETNGCQIAKDYLLKSREIAKQLVTDQVAHSIEDVDTVLMRGFYHAYGTQAIKIPTLEEIES